MPGYLQQFGIDFYQTFAGVVKLMVFRILFALAAYYNLDIKTIGIKTAVFYSLINPLVFVQISKESEDAIKKEIIC